jgi:hypothetical protein
MANAVSAVLQLRKEFPDMGEKYDFTVFGKTKERIYFSKYVFINS